MKEKAVVPHTPFVSMILPTANRFQSAIYSACAALMQRKLPLHVLRACSLFLSVITATYYCRQWWR